MKKCKACGIEKETLEFNKHSTTKDRLQQKCKPCHRAESRAYAAAGDRSLRLANCREWYKNNKEKAAATASLWYQNNKERSAASARKRYAKNPKPMLEATKRWEKKNPEKRKAIAKRYALANPSRLTSYTARKRAEKLAMPKWANQFFIHEAYRLSALRTKMLGIKYTVDHIVPLYGKTVCGLHVENNLAVIPHATNARKGNRHWPQMP